MLTFVLLLQIFLLSRGKKDNRCSVVTIRAEVGYLSLLGHRAVDVVLRGASPTLLFVSPNHLGLLVA